MAIQSYSDEVNIKNELKLRELLTQLPSFCKQFFIGIESRTQSRTRIAYAYDLIVFFDYLKQNSFLKPPFGFERRLLFFAKILNVVGCFF